MTNLLTNPKERTRFFRFAIVGTIGAVVDFGVLNLLLFLGLPFLISSIISFIAAVFNNFAWNRFWTYPDSRTKNISTQLTQFAIINVIGLAIRTPLLALIEKNLIRFFTSILPSDFFFSAEFAGHNAALAIAIIIVMFWNYLANRFWTYNDVDKE
ncbi:MAG: GtrA family protein [Anaerolineaceae bacterium]|nr:GtrA family protein [Anaerolineaceae bacterium]